jgi:hypothetical protein
MTHRPKTPHAAMVLVAAVALLLALSESAALSQQRAGRDSNRAAEKRQRSSGHGTSPRVPSKTAEDDPPSRTTGAEMDDDPAPVEPADDDEEKPRKPPLERYTFNSRFYAVTTDLPDKALSKDIARHMDSVYAEYATRMAGFRPNPYAAVKPGERMPLYVIQRYEDYLALLQGFGFNAQNSGGVFFRGPGGSGLATWVEGQSRLKMYYVLQHEGFHQFADARLASNLPPWVNEGLAEYFGDALMVRGRLQPGKLDRERLDRMKRAVDEGAVLSFRELMSMDNQQWMARVTSGDKASSLMYDMSWSVCYSLIHGGRQYQAALSKYLELLNRGIEPPRAFEQVFGANLENFESAWKKGLTRMESDAWYSSVRHLQLMAAALKLFHEKGIEVKSFSHLKEQLIRYKFRAQIRERDVVSRGERKVKVEHVEQNFDFPNPAVAELIPSTDGKLPHGLVVKGIKPTLKLSWRVNESGAVEEEIQYEGK